MNKKLVEEINKQISYEIFSAHLYMAMAAYAIDVELPGIGAWFLAQADEEKQHADKFIAYLQQRNQRALILGIEQPKNDYNSALEAFQYGLNHEKFVTSRINDLMKIAHEDNDYATVNFLNWFIDEQVEEEASFAAIIGKLNLVNNSPVGLYQLDKELGARTFAPVQ